MVSALADVLLESHEKGPPSFLGGGVGTEGASFCGAGGGGAKGTEGRLPDKPCIRGGGFGGWAGATAALSLDVIVVEREREEAAS